MKIKQTLKRLVIGLVLVLGLVTAAAVVTPAATVDAACDPATQNCCGGVQTSLIECKQDGTGTDIENSGIWGILVLVVNIMTAGVGVLAIMGIIYASILYTTAGGSEDQIKKAKGVIMNVMIGIVVFLLMFSFVNFLVPGGVLRP